MRKPCQKKPTKKILLLICLVLIAGLVVIGKISPGMGFATDEAATESAIPEEEIKENLKERLEKASREKPEIFLKRAWVGTLDSIANHTLTIETRDGPRLASVSAETTYVLMPKRDSLKLADLELGSYTIAMGYLNGNQVLNALRVIIEKETPKPPDRLVQFIKISNFNAKTDSLTGSSASGETITGELTDKTVLTTIKDGNLDKVTSESLLTGKKFVAIIQSQEKNNQPLNTFLHIHILQEPQDKEPSPADSSESTSSSFKE